MANHLPRTGLLGLNPLWSINTGSDLMQLLSPDELGFINVGLIIDNGSIYLYIYNNASC
jgi:hypothetical protein